MSRRSLITLSLAAALAAPPVAAAQPQSGIVRPAHEPSRPSVKLGGELYAGNCASCHGIGGSGVSRPRPGAGDIAGAGPPLRGVGARAADFYLRTGLMPLSNIRSEPARDRVQFTDTEIRSLISYVASLSSGPAIPRPDPAAGDISEGFEQFNDHCAGCHQSLARGGFVTGARVPPLQDVDAVEIAEAVRIGPYLMPRFSSTQITDAQLNSIIRYVLSTRHPDDRGGSSLGNVGPIPEGMVAWLAAIALAVLCVGLGKRLLR